MHLQLPFGPRKLTVAALTVGVLLLLPGWAGAITPEDPKVKALVTKALQFLEKNQDNRLGAQCLIALCFKKAGQEDHPKIKAATDECYRMDLKDRDRCDNYSLGIALAFLCEIDTETPPKHHDQIVKYVDELLARQTPYGAWTYPAYPVGDTSQTQYAVLGMWLAKNNGKIDIPIDRMEGVCGWLMRTQDQGGGWPYQPQDPGTYNRIQQDASSITNSRSAAASGSLYMLADLLQVTQRVDTTKATVKSKAMQDIDVPEAKKVIRGPLTRTLNPAEIKNTIALADRHLGTGFTPAVEWNHYYMYALERYHSFRENGGGGKDNKWYDQGYEYLSKTQTPDGHWDGTDRSVTCTCFATLFLLRSAKKTIDKKLSEGIAKGGNGLPPNVKDLTETANGTVVNAGLVLPTDTILKLIQEGQSDDVTRKAEEKEALALSQNPTDRNRQIEQLRNFVGAGKFEARMVAVTTLGKIRDLDNVPKLLYALTDPDHEIVREADKGLRFISRKVGGVGLPDGELTVAQIKAAQAAWKAWYLSIRPDAELLD